MIDITIRYSLIEWPSGWNPKDYCILSSTNRSRHAERVIKEEKNSRYDNQPYGKILPIVKENMFESHPYRWSTIGSMEHLDTTLEDFKDFHKKFIPTMLF
jgi:hypothetical protein